MYLSWSSDSSFSLEGFRWIYITFLSVKDVHLHLSSTLVKKELWLLYVTHLFYSLHMYAEYHQDIFKNLGVMEHSELIDQIIYEEITKKDTKRKLLCTEHVFLSNIWGSHLNCFLPPRFSPIWFFFVCVFVCHFLKFWATLAQRLLKECYFLQLLECLKGFS